MLEKNVKNVETRINLMNCSCLKFMNTENRHLSIKSEKLLVSNTAVVSRLLYSSLKCKTTHSSNHLPPFSRVSPLKAYSEIHSQPSRFPSGGEERSENTHVIYFRNVDRVEFRSTSTLLFRAYSREKKMVWKLISNAEISTKTHRRYLFSTKKKCSAKRISLPFHFNQAAIRVIFIRFSCLFFADAF